MHIFMDYFGGVATSGTDWIADTIPQNSKTTSKT